MSPAQIQQEQLAGTNPIRCVLVHDHVLLRQGLRRILEDEPGIEVVAEAGTAAEALQRVFEHRPEIVIADAGSFTCTAELAEKLILRESPHSKVLFLSMQEGAVSDQQSFPARQTSAEQLVEMVRRAHAPRGNLQEMPRTAAEAVPQRKRALTARETEVLELLAEGRTVRSVAEMLGLSVKTVDAHKFNLMRKLGIHNRAELVLWVMGRQVTKRTANF